MSLKQTYAHACIEFKTTVGHITKTTGDLVSQASSSYQRRLLCRAVKLLDVEIQRSRDEHISEVWKRDGMNGSKISQARSPSLWLDRISYSSHQRFKTFRYPNTESVFLDKKKQQTLKTTSAVWPISRASQAESLRK